LIPYLSLENEGTKQEESLDSKSDGEKAIISLIADIAYNLSIAKDFARDNDFLNSPGIVLIDELETHLHPNWQRQIIPILTSIFPAIQFFIATHSPQIVSSVNSESVFLCDNFNVDKVYLKTKGEDTNSLLKYIFNSTDRPEEYIGLLNRFNLLIEQKAPYADIEAIIREIANIESDDKSGTLSNLVGDLQLQLEAYKFDREYEENN
jgi:predicted ATP-binding protein involved in virulence